uniref:Uncharacterized protein n=1 Tax=Panagrolaimus sp. JU765 TaxID=591449 RepID=A0AC34Q2Z7_9BILA
MAPKSGKKLHGYFIGAAVYINSGNVGKKTLLELKKILQQCQVENLSLRTTAWVTHRYTELMDILMEPCKFVTVLNIDSDFPEFKYVDFYKNIRHLKSLTIRDSTGMIMDLPYFPPKLELKSSEYFLPLLAEKTLNHPLSFLKIDRPVQLTDVQQFLMRANLEIGAEIHFCFKNESKIFIGFLTFIGNGLFEYHAYKSVSGRCRVLRVLYAFEYFILDQQMNSQNRKILKLSAGFGLNRNEKIPFTVTSVSNPDNVVCSGEFTDGSSEKTVSENVAECVKVMNPDYPTHYSSQLLDDWFPRTENCDPFDRVETVNKALGTYISVVTPEMLEEIIERELLAEFHVETIKLNRF